MRVKEVWGVEGLCLEGKILSKGTIIDMKLLNDF